MNKFTKWNQNLIVKMLEAKGFTRDPYKNLIKEVNGKKYRLKFQDNSIRFELSGTTSWIRLATCFYRQLTIEDDGARTIMHGFIYAQNSLKVSLPLDTLMLKRTSALTGTNEKATDSSN